ncbi:MAG: DUF2283 domain-containing protein [Methanosarcinales archaeon]
MGKMNIWFDEEGDFLEISIKNKRGFYKDIGDDIWMEVDEKGNLQGIAILNFRKRLKDNKMEFDLPLEIPLIEV